MPDTKPTADGAKLYASLVAADTTQFTKQVEGMTLNELVETKKHAFTTLQNAQHVIFGVNPKIEEIAKPQREKAEKALAELREKMESVEKELSLLSGAGVSRRGNSGGTRPRLSGEETNAQKVAKYIKDHKDANNAAVSLAIYGPEATTKQGYIAQIRAKVAKGEM